MSLATQGEAKRMTEGEKLRSNPRHKDRVPVIVRWQPTGGRTPQTLKLSVPKQMKLVGSRSGFLLTVQEKVKDVDFSKVCLSIDGHRLDHTGSDAGKTIQKFDEEHKFPDHILYVDLEILETESKCAPQPEVTTVHMTLDDDSDQEGGTEQALGGRSDEDPVEHVTSLHVVHLADNEDMQFDDIDYDDWNQQQSSIKGKSAEAKRVLEKHPGRVPVHCQEADAVPPRVKKLLPPNHMTVEELKRVCWKHFQSPAGEPTRRDAPLPFVELSIGNMLLEQPLQTMEDLYNLYKSNTGLLQVSVRFSPDNRYESLEDEVKHLTGVVADHEEARRQTMIMLQDMKDLCGGKDEAVESAEKAKREAREAEARCIELELECQQRLSKVQDELIEKTALNRQLEAQMAEMLAAIENQERKSEKSDAQQADLKEKIKDLEAKLLAKTRECDDHKAAEQAAVQKVATLREQLDNSQLRDQEGRKEAKEAAEQNVEMRKALARAQSSIEQLQAASIEDRKLMQQLQERTEAEQQKQVEVVKRLREKNEAFRAALEVERAAKDSYAAQLADLQKEAAKEEDHFDEGFLVVQDRVL